MKLVDSHCHVQFNAYKEDGGEVIGRALAEEVMMIVAGSQATTSERAVKLAEEYPGGVWAVVGLHPIHLTSQEVDEEEIHFKSREEIFDYDFYKKLASHPRVAGIGEAGFDLHHLSPGLSLEEAVKKQKETFDSQCALADELELPIVLHCREAHDILPPLLEEKVRAGQLKKRGVAHCFGGSWPIAKRYLDIGFYLGFTGIIAFEPRAGQRKTLETLWEVVKKTPLNRILIETDAPYLAPPPHRGKRNEPLFVKLVAAKVAALRNLPLEETAAATTANAKKLFNLDLT
ncbi:MAG: TatD family hydrolase [Candidatus Magasanikbacteria bacterium]|nr:TatD family hydrolase [Candidatus Magasanikbacteria bacterium]